MKAFIIYDEEGNVYAVRYGENQYIPNELRGLYQEVPEGALIEGVAVSDPDNHKILFTPSKENILEKELAVVKAQLAYISMMSNIDIEGV
ncbi:MAG: hypothetical protein QM657_15515 [Lacrimispora sp.]|uniref:hypothetical protein n=1 Tax=Lacrimispora sp. TaxID=2719234 RepID=UPI0039E28F7F